MAGALGVRLGGCSEYGGRVEYRPELGSGPGPAVTDIPRAVRLSGVVGAATVVGAVAIATGVTAVRRAVSKR
jgi:adenosylcobinamide-phosphate synthase